MRLRTRAAFVAIAGLIAWTAFGDEKDAKYLDPIDVHVPSVLTDKSVNIDYDIVYVRAKRAGDKVHKRFFTDFSQPVTMEPGADLMLLHPNGKEEVLVEGGNGSVTDPVVSFDGQWVYYVHIHNLQNASQWNPPREGADIYKVNVQSKKIVKLTNQHFSPESRRRQLVARFPHAAGWQIAFRVRRLQHGAVPAAGRAHCVHQQPRWLSAGEGLSGHRVATLRHG